MLFTLIYVVYYMQISIMYLHAIIFFKFIIFTYCQQPVSLEK